MQEILIPGFIMGGFALVFSSGLLYASKKFYVFVDPKIEQVGALLAGANCGGCGLPGCGAYAERAVKNNSIDPPCPVASAEDMAAIAGILGIEASASDKKVATLMCHGTHENSAELMEYAGIEDCWAASLVVDSTKTCVFSCLGLSSCVRACGFDAMKIENGIVVIDDEKCTGCAMCLPACPKNLLELRPASSEVVVTCYNTDRGADARKACKVACIGCMKCEKTCEHDAIHVNNFLAAIDYQKCTNCYDCVEVCPTDSIQIRRNEVYVASA